MLVDAAGALRARERVDRAHDQRVLGCMRARSTRSPPAPSSKAARLHHAIERNHRQEDRSGLAAACVPADVVQEFRRPTVASESRPAPRPRGRRPHRTGARGMRAKSTRVRSRRRPRSRPKAQGPRRPRGGRAPPRRRPPAGTRNRPRPRTVIGRGPAARAAPARPARPKASHQDFPGCRRTSCRGAGWERELGERDQDGAEMAGQRHDVSVGGAPPGGRGPGSTSVARAEAHQHEVSSAAW